MPHRNKSGMVECYGCGHPMHYALEVHEVEGETIYYGLVCAIWRRIKLKRPGQHDKGTISNGSATMRERS